MCAVLVDIETLDSIYCIVEELLRQPTDVVVLLARKLDALLTPYYQQVSTFNFWCYAIRI